MIVVMIIMMMRVIVWNSAGSLGVWYALLLLCLMIMMMLRVMLGNGAGSLGV